MIRSGAPTSAISVQRQSIAKATPKSEISATTSRPAPVMNAFHSVLIVFTSPFRRCIR